MGWELIIPVVAGGVRNIAGWLENSFKDGKIQGYEWGQLISTIIQVGILSFSAMYGLGLDVTQATGVGVLGSFILSAVKKIGQ